MYIHLLAVPVTASVPSNGNSDSLQNGGHDRLTHHERRIHSVKVECFEFILPVINVFYYKYKVRSLKCVDRAGVSTLV